MSLWYEGVEMSSQWCGACGGMVVVAALVGAVIFMFMIMIGTKKD